MNEDQKQQAIELDRAGKGCTEIARTISEMGPEISVTQVRYFLKKK